jgi:aminoglycoside phosphotransferase (APT) family kinase protein
MIQLETKREPLQAYLQAELGLDASVQIRDLSRMAMGQSRAMYRVDLSDGEGVEQSVVVRVEQWGLLGSDSRNEVRVMRALHAAGQPVAEIFAYEESDALLGQPFFVMEFVPGSSVYTRKSLDEYVVTLDALHRLDPDALGLDFLARPEGARAAALSQVERWYQVYRGGLVGEPSPLVEEAAQWLRNQAPESERIGLVHGDPGPGNYLQQDDRVSCLVDWEFSYVGDPYDDWAYLISMRGMGVMSQEQWVDYLRRQVAVDLEPERLRYWMALNFFKGVCIDQTALKSYMLRDNLAPNMLAIGTAVHLSALKRLSAAIL